MKLEYSPELKAALGHALQCAAPLFLMNDADHEQQEASLLMVLAGMGAVEMTVQANGAPYWVATSTLKTVLADLDRKSKALTNIGKNDDLPPNEVFNKMLEQKEKVEAQSGSGEQTSAPRILGSLELAIAALREHSQTLRSGASNIVEITSEETLLALAGSGRARLVSGAGGGFVWVPSIVLLREFESLVVEKEPKEGIRETSKQKYERTRTKKRLNRKRRIRMDDLFTHHVRNLYKDMRLHFPGIPLDHDFVAISALIRHEMAGEAIAYRDSDGHLTWKASEDFRREYERDD
jgi:hypothetical protein